MVLNFKKIALFGATMVSCTVIAQKVEAIDKKGTIVDVNNNIVTAANSAPSDPVENDVWLDTSDSENTRPKIWNGTAWLNMDYTGTTGSIFFSGSDNNPSQDNNNLFWDSTNERLGLGTNLPSVRLDVNGNTRIRNLPAGLDTDEVVISDTDGNIRKLPITGLETNTTISQNTSNGDITHNSEDGTSQTVNVISTDSGNNIAAGNDGGAFYSSPIKAYGTVLSSANSAIATGVTSIVKNNTGRFTFTFSTTRTTVNYPIQLTVLETGTENINIYVTAQTTTTFSISIIREVGGTFPSDSFVDRNFYFNVLDF